MLDTSAAGGPPPIHGRDAAVRMIRGAVERASTAHQVHSPQIELHGDTADVVWAMQDRVVWSPERRPAPDTSGIPVTATIMSGMCGWTGIGGLRPSV